VLQNGKVFDDNRSATSVRVLLYIKRVREKEKKRVVFRAGWLKLDSVDDVIRGTNTRTRNLHL
jgi:hypothetical protein